MGFTWGVSGYDHTWYNHTVPPNSEVPNCTLYGPQSLELANWRTSHHGVHKASSRHTGGVHVLFMDGSLRLENDAIDLTVWRALATRDGGEI